ncbi:MAG: hypothetical protein IJ298_03665 [Ruminococcus sp.]|nr:hypothetical protein [Ruminococcus sp.]
MPLVAAKCTQCGQNLQIDDAKEAAVCPYCDTPFITEKAINNYKLEIGNVVVEGVSVETKLNNAEVFYKMHGNANRARELFEEVVDIAPADWRGWWGLVRISTQEFTRVRIGSEHVARIEYNANCAFNCVKDSDPAIFNVLQEQWNSYLARINSEWREGVVDDLSQAVREKERIEAEIKDKSRRMQDLSASLTTAENDLRHCSMSKFTPGAWAYVVSIVLCAVYGLGLIVLIPLVARYIYLWDKGKKLGVQVKDLRLRRDTLSSEVYSLQNELEKQKKKIDSIEHTLKYTGENI